MERAFFERLALVKSGGDSIRRSMAASSFYAAVETVRAKGNGGSNRTAVKKVLLRAESRLPRGGFFFSAAGQIRFKYFRITAGGYLLFSNLPNIFFE